MRLLGHPRASLSPSSGTGQPVVFRTSAHFSFFRAQLSNVFAHARNRARLHSLTRRGENRPVNGQAQFARAHAPTAGGAHSVAVHTRTRTRNIVANVYIPITTHARARGQTASMAGLRPKSYFRHSQARARSKSRTRWCAQAALGRGGHAPTTLISKRLTRGRQPQKNNYLSHHQSAVAALLLLSRVPRGVG